MTDEQIENLAEQWASDRVPSPKYTLSVSKPDLKAGFIAGFKAAEDIFADRFVEHILNGGNNEAPQWSFEDAIKGM